MSVTKELLQFRTGEPDDVLERMHEIATRRNGREWINVQPWVDQDRMPKVTIFRQIFSNRGFVVPTGTWVPGKPDSKRPDIDEIGITHPAGNNALGTLAEAGVTVPDAWQAIQDHTRRGIVIEARAGTDPKDILDWLISAAPVLAGDLDVDDRWVAGFLTQD